MSKQKKTKLMEGKDMVQIFVNPNSQKPAGF